jgi:meso-butanediol dehydrogenase / (S,S)-butanediol dehydrogenase / diacetyl reductase
MDFRDKVVRITGAAGGIGRSVVRGFHDGHAKLALVQLTEESLTNAIAALDLDSRCVLAIAANVKSEEEVIRYVRKTTERFGHIDVLFNDAGIEGKVGSLAETDAERLN